MVRARLAQTSDPNGDPRMAHSRRVEFGGLAVFVRLADLATGWGLNSRRVGEDESLVWDSRWAPPQGSTPMPCVFAVLRHGIGTRREMVTDGMERFRSFNWGRSWTPLPNILPYPS